MTKRAADASLLSFEVDRQQTNPLHRQIAARVRNAITSGRLHQGARLPSTRTLAEELGVSRNTVKTAFDQLRAEGYLTARTGDGTRVRTHLASGGSLAGPDPGPVAHRGRVTAPRRFHTVSLSSDTPYVRPPAHAFAPGVPALDAFPGDLWRRLAARAMRREGHRLLQQVDPGGYDPLKEAIAEHIRMARGVECDSTQIVITAGAQQAFGLCCDVLLRRGDRVWFENPGYSGALGAFRYHDITPTPIPIDREGLVVRRGQEIAPRARGAYVTPTHQFPLGMPMSLKRRLALIDWARRRGRWIMEDDYDSEFRFEGPPLPALYGLDDSGRVIYIGTFSKSVFPSLRVGFVVLPPDLVAPFTQARAYRDHHSPVLTQAILAEFILGGHFARHVRSMRVLYRARQHQLLERLDHAFGSTLDMPETNTGLHVTVFLPARVRDRAVSDAAAARGVRALALSQFTRGRTARGGLVLGFGGLTEEKMAAGIAGLRRAFDHVTASKKR